MADTKRSMQCGHCGKLVVFDVRGEGTQDGAVLLESPYNEEQDITTWRILECTWCKKPTLEETKTSYNWVDGPIYSGMEPVSSAITILYPGAKTAKVLLTNLPETIEKKYLAALKVQDIEPSACAVLVGRTLVLQSHLLNQAEEKKEASDGSKTCRMRAHRPSFTQR